MIQSFVSYSVIQYLGGRDVHKIAWVLLAAGITQGRDVTHCNSLLYIKQEYFENPECLDEFEANFENILDGTPGVYVLLFYICIYTNF